MNLVASRTRFQASDAVIAAGGVLLAVTQLIVPTFGTTPLLAGLTVVGLAVCAFGGAWRAWGAGATVTIACCIIVLTFLVEILGSRTDVPFGAYDYTGRLTPALAGVPLIVPLAWFGLGVAAWATVSWITASRAGRVVLGALALTAWDVFLDPQMVGAGFWEWSHPGRWSFRGIPFSNYGGWFLTSLVVMVVISAYAGSKCSTPLLALYTWMAVMHAIGFIVFFDDRTVGMLGAAAMLPFALAGWWRRSLRV